MSDEIHDRHDPLGDVQGVVDTKYEAEGDWFEHTPDPRSEEPERPNQIDGFRNLLLDADGNGLRRVKVRGRETPDYEAASAKLQTRLLRMNGAARAEFSRTQQRRLDAKHCLLDWEFTNRAGEPIPFSPELAERVMLERRFRHHRNFVQIAIATLQGDIEQVAEEDRGNS